MLVNFLLTAGGMVWHSEFVMSYPSFSILEHIIVVDATAGAKTITMLEGAWEVSGNITNKTDASLVLQHRPSSSAPPSVVVLPEGVGYSRLFKSVDKHVAVMSELAITVPVGSVAVFQIEADYGYPEPIVA